MKLLTFKEFLMESPLHDYETIGDFSKNSSFRDPRDRRIIQHPKAIERVRKKFGNTEFDFDFYFVNSTKANKHTEVGLVPPEWVKENLGDDVYNAIAKNLGQNHIQVIFTNNKGSERVPLTAWMMAHRLGHVLARKNRLRDSRGQYMEASNHLIQQVGNILQAYGQQSFGERGEKSMNSNRKDQLTMIHFFQSVCTFKSARDKNLRDWFEVLNELIAQYLTTGKIKFNKAPQSFGGRDKYYLRNASIEDVSDELETLGRDMQYLIDDILGSVVNGVLVM